jgi:hypothetical protein
LGKERCVCGCGLRFKDAFVSAGDAVGGRLNQAVAVAGAQSERLDPTAEDRARPEVIQQLTKWSADTEWTERGRSVFGDDSVRCERRDRGAPARIVHFLPGGFLIGIQR